MLKPLQIRSERRKLTSSQIPTVVGNAADENRLYVRDALTGTQFLTNTGATISVVPAAQGCEATGNFAYATNGTPIQLFGKKVLDLDLGLRRKFQWSFFVAGVTKPILGADFLRYYGILVDLQARWLVDREIGLTSEGKVAQYALHGIFMITPGIPALITVLLKQFEQITIDSNPRAASLHQIRHHIITHGPPIVGKARRVPPGKYKMALREFQFMMDKSICRPSSSPWASPLHLVSKKNGTWRSCGDYRTLNSIAVPDSYPIPNIQDFAYKLHDKKIFSTLDLVRAYFQVPVNEEDIPKTAVITPFGLFSFTVMTFRMCNATQLFQRFMDSIFRDLDFRYVYIDDLLIASRTLLRSNKKRRKRQQFNSNSSFN